MQLIWVHTVTGDEQRWTIYGQSAFLRLTEEGELRASATPTSLRIEIEGQNVFVLDTGDGSPISIAGVAVEKGRRRAWGRNQELRVGTNVALWVADSAMLRAQTSPNPEFLRRSAVVIGTLVLLTFLFGLIGYRATTAKNTVQVVVASAPTATPAPTATQTPTITPAPTATQTPTATPAPTNTQAPTTVPITVVSPLHIPASPTPNPPPLTVSIASPAQPEVWDARLDALGVKFVPAIVPVGDEFWRLFEAEWLDEWESSGRHHIFIDIVDAELQHIQNRQVSVRVSSAGGSAVCTPTVDLNIQRAFGADCPMYSSGFAYTASIDGLPSDLVEGLGLGTIEDRFAPIRTSFILRFRLERRTSN